MREWADHPAYALLLDQLRQQIGLDPTSACAGKVPAALADLGVADELKLAAYVLAAQRQPLLLHDLIRLIVVHETWLFREPAAFEVLVQAGLEAAAAGRRFKVLSAPCSTGEEPCSIALALIKAGVPRELIDILALDISGDAVQQARAGSFAEMAFRGVTPEWRDARFVRDGQRWRLRSRLDDVIRFEIANLMDLPAHIANEHFDAVFCRNLLIYLDTPARRQRVEQLRALARPDTGLIFVGHAESTDAFQGELARVALPMSFGFHNRASVLRQTSFIKTPPFVAKPAPLRTAEVGPRRGGMIVPSVSSRPVAPATPITTTALPASSVRPTIDPLRDVRLLADRGEIDRAVTLCEQAILSHPDLADVRCYRGVLAVAAGEAHVARASFTKALYLDPRHADSLHHLMLLAQGEGDAMGAQRYRDRLQRLQAPVDSHTTAASSREVRS
jgi:chemotaxis protein methyltransferase WspC